VARRIDFYDDPSAPEANSLVPSANVVVSNSAGEVLLIRRSDNDNWAVPGGAIDLGESLVQAAVRETREETGLDSYSMDRSMRLRIGHYLEGRAVPYLG
jgi:ADP-ribose pyrophosphatase YjhB (NUDIX family)